MPALKITERQAELFRRLQANLGQAQREMQLVTAAILSGHDVVDAEDIQLVCEPGAPPLLVYQVPALPAQE